MSEINEGKPSYEIDVNQMQTIEPSPDILGATNVFKEAIKKQDQTNRRRQGRKNAEVARKEMEEIFKSPKNPLYFSKDIDFAKKYGVTRLTIYKIRDDLKVPSRAERLIVALKNIDTKEYTVQELGLGFNVKYQNLYNIMKNNKIPYKV